MFATLFSVMLGWTKPGITLAPPAQLVQPFAAALMAVPMGALMQVVPLEPSGKYVPGEQHTAVPTLLQCPVWPLEQEGVQPRNIMLVVTLEL